MSIAILYTNPDFRASAMSADGAAFGIVYPHAARGDGRRRIHARAARRADARARSSPAPMLYTSGLGGTFPRGIAIGSVRAGAQDGRGVDAHVSAASGRDAVARDDGADPHGAARHAGRRETCGARRSTPTRRRRRIAAAGDSIARQAAMLEAQARQAALDSVKRATIDSVKQRARRADAAGQPRPTARQPSAPKARSRRRTGGTSRA